MTDGTYPQDRPEWQSAIQDGIGASWTAGRDAYQGEGFSYEKLEPWIREAFNLNFSPDFVPAPPIHGGA
jgi:hypothetical protein